MKTKLIAAALSLAFAASAHANPDKIREAITKSFPGMEIKSVQPAATSGLWEVFNGNEILYFDSEAKFFFPAPLIDVASKANLTQARLDKLLVVDFKSLPTGDAIQIVKGDGSRKLAVFADPRCGYCKKLETEIAGLTNATVFVYLTPILGPESVTKASAIWCAPKPAEAWDKFMLSNIEPPAPARSDKCDATAVTNNQALARRVGVRGTPTLVYEDGSRSYGLALPALETRLSEVKASIASAPTKVATK
jgi:thiol:disulfide interchange protein DsbC